MPALISLPRNAGEFDRVDKNQFWDSQNYPKKFSMAKKGIWIVIKMISNNNNNH